MSLYAYSNEEKTGEMTKADIADAEEAKRVCFCSTKECTAKLHLCAYKASNKKAPYFSAFKDYPHIEECVHNSNNKNHINRSQRDDSNFIISDFIDKLTSSNVTTNRHRNTAIVKTKTLANSKRTALQLNLPAVYRFCKGCSTTEPFSADPNMFIFMFLADDRSNFFFTKGLYGNLMVECRYEEAKSSVNYLRFFYPIDKNAKHQYDIVLSRKFTPCFDALTKKLTKVGDTPIVFVGEWKKSNNKTYFYCNLQSLNQVYIAPSIELP